MIDEIRRKLTGIPIALGIAAHLPLAHAVTGKGNRAGVVDFVSGNAQLVEAGGSHALTDGTVVYAGQTIETGREAEAHLVFDDGGFLAVRPQSRLSIDQVKMTGGFDDSLTMTLLRGALRSVTGWVGKFDRRSYQLNVGTATVGIRGTDHEVLLIPEGEAGPGEIPGIHNWVNEGGTTLHNAGGSLDVEAGHAAWAGHDGRLARAHVGIPQFLHRWRLVHEERANRHAAGIRDHIEMRLRLKGMLQGNEHLEDAQRRHQLLRQRWREQRGIQAEPDDGPKPHKGFREWLEKHQGDAREKAGHEPLWRKKHRERGGRDD